MKSYKVIYKETLVHTFYVDAKDEESAKEAFEEDLMQGKVDFSDGEVSDTEYEVEEMGEYIPSAENGDYSPSTPWNAPGCSIDMFININD